MEYKRRFGKTKKHLTDQARKAMFSVMTKVKKLCLPVDIQLQLFDSMLSPILLYGSEVWGYENIAIISQFQLKFYKYMLKLKMSTPTIMVMGELGACPIENKIYSNMLNFWGRLISGKQDKISSILYRTMYNLHEKGIVHCEWVAKIKSILDNIGCTEYWIMQSIPNLNYFKSKVKSSLYDQYLQNWSSNVYNSSKCLNYRIYKTELKLEKYLLCLPTNLAIALCKFRCLNSNLPVEKGRFYGIERANRLCTLCNRQEIGDEFHYLFNCNHFINERRKYIPRNFYRYPNVFNFRNLMCSTDKNTLIKIALFAKIIMLNVN